MLLFVVLHVLHFRFGPVTMVTTAGGQRVRDLFSLEMELFADPRMVAFYAASVGVLGYHLSLGWAKVALKIGLPQPLVKPAAAIGKFAVWPLCLGFAAVPLYLHAAGESCRAGLPAFA